MDLSSALQLACLVPSAAGSLYALLCVAAGWRLRRSPPLRARFTGGWPAVSVLKPVCGLEHDLEPNLRSACLQDYPGDFEVVYSVQSEQDPALPILRRLERELGPERVRVAIDPARAGANGKVNNLAVGLARARHEVLVISDSDVRLGPDYLRTIVAPLADPGVGYACTFYRARGARNLWERLELLTVNAELLPNFMFAVATGVASPCLGASTALRRKTLDAIGGIAALADYLVEDYEMGARIRARGQRGAVLPYLVDTSVDVPSASRGWKHLLYWEQNNRAANPAGATAFALVRAVPFALLYALLRGLDSTGLAVLGAVVGVRLSAAALFMGAVSADRDGLRELWLLPLRDLAGLASWAVALFARRTTWRDDEFDLVGGGKLVRRIPPARTAAFTGDDFGFASELNAAIERAHREGVLGRASLMVGAPAAADAVLRAHRNPELRVGLHVVVCGGPEHQLRSALAIFFWPPARRRLAAEIRAQFEAFAATGLCLDHADGHRHMHLHPTVSRLVLAIGREFGLPAVRVPREPWRSSARAAGRGAAKRALAQLFLWPWVALLRRRIRRSGMRANDWLFGLYDSGHMTAELVLRQLRALPPGTSELYFHPATERSAALERAMPGYEHVRELEALLDPALRAACETLKREAGSR